MGSWCQPFMVSSLSSTALGKKRAPEPGSENPQHTATSPPLFFNMAQELEAGVHNEADLIEIATRLACEGYWQDIRQLKLVSRVFRYDEQLWDAMKNEPGESTQGTAL